MKRVHEELDKLSHRDSSWTQEAATRRSIHDLYEVGCRLTVDSAGVGGEVRRGVRKADGKPFAVKVIRFAGTQEDRGQIQALMAVNHPGIIQLVDWFEDPQTLWVVMELALGGELFGRITQRGRFSESEAAAAVRQILEAVGHMHSRGIVHCDLKPENILYGSDAGDAIKVADFGFAQFVPDSLAGDALLHRPLGTFSYTAPEILKSEGYGCQVDMWSLGVIVYVLLSGVPPFFKRSAVETLHDVRLRIIKGTCARPPARPSCAARCATAPSTPGARRFRCWGGPVTHTRLCVIACVRTRFVCARAHAWCPAARPLAPEVGPLSLT
jgi:serine/threonine protein kinase